MPGHTRRVSFRDDFPPELEPRRTRGRSRPRSRSAERVHTILDDVAGDMPARERVVTREAYDKLLRENQFLNIQLREFEQSRTWVDELRRENRELRLAADCFSENEARKDDKLHALRKKYAKLETEVSELKTKVAHYTKKATRFEELYNEIKRSYDDAQRRLLIMRRNMDVLEAENRQLEQTKDALNQRLAIEERLNARRPTRF
ncbi:0ce156fd-493a-45c4-a571-0f390ce0187d [Thermothielavioides terrestris]|uniref:0ce156fd-493a-45c4-a571-0f390ce0187d n=1 Tax=Thermothielavioides terrestris TaxID=2587410 RepID=A0A446BDM0_9PEZI|nr:0ce156fd-493a-45c4-a571-0f390ce0187d [Thermothielavioides terrestris]